MPPSPENLQPNIGEILRSKGILNEEHLQILRGHPNRRQLPVHRLILDLNLASEQDTLQALAKVHGVEFQDLEDFAIPEALLESVPLKLIFHYRFLPLAVSADEITIACGDVPSSLELAHFRFLLKREVRFLLTTPSRINAVIKSQFGLGAETVEKLRESSQSELLDDDELVFDLADSILEERWKQKETDEDGAVEGTISDLVDQILAEALRLRATDVSSNPAPDQSACAIESTALCNPFPSPENCAAYTPPSSLDSK